MIESRHADSLDLVAELKLRQWARRNYVTPSLRRDDDWHSVVLEEMRLRDNELASIEPLRTVVTSTGIVPLEPSRHERIDAGHDLVRGPHIGQHVARGNAVIPHFG